MGNEPSKQSKRFVVRQATDHSLRLIPSEQTRPSITIPPTASASGSPGPPASKTQLRKKLTNSKLRELGGKTMDLIGMTRNNSSISTLNENASAKPSSKRKPVPINLFTGGNTDRGISSSKQSSLNDSITPKLSSPDKRSHLYMRMVEQDTGLNQSTATISTEVSTSQSIKTDETASTSTTAIAAGGVSTGIHNSFSSTTITTTRAPTGHSRNFSSASGGIVQVVRAPSIDPNGEEDPCLKALCGIKKFDPLVRPAPNYSQPYFINFFGNPSRPLPTPDFTLNSSSLYNIAEMFQKKQQFAFDVVNKNQRILSNQIKSLDEISGRTLQTSSLAVRQYTQFNENFTNEVKTLAHKVHCTHLLVHSIFQSLHKLNSTLRMMEQQDLCLGPSTAAQYPLISQRYKRTAERLSKQFKIVGDSISLLPRHPSSAYVHRESVSSYQHMIDSMTNSTAGNNSMTMDNGPTLLEDSSSAFSDDHNDILPSISLAVQPILQPEAPAPKLSIVTKSRDNGLISSPPPPISKITPKPPISNRERIRPTLPVSPTSNQLTVPANVTLLDSLVRSVTEVMSTGIPRSRSLGLIDQATPPPSSGGKQPYKYREVELLQSKLRAEAAERHAQPISPASSVGNFSLFSLPSKSNDLGVKLKGEAN